MDAGLYVDGRTDGEPLGVGDPLGVVLGVVLGGGDGLGDDEALGDGLDDWVGPEFGGVLGAGELERQLFDPCGDELGPDPLD